MGFRTKWAIGCLGLAALWIAFAVTRSMLLLGLVGAIVAVFGVLVSRDWRGLATELRRSQASLGQDASVYRVFGYFTTVIGLVFLASAVLKAS